MIKYGLIGGGAIAVGVGAYLAYRSICKQQPTKASAADSKGRNTAIIFIKPHANNPKVQKLVREQLEMMGLRVLLQKNVPAAEIAQRSLAATHYYAIASKAGYVPEFNSPAQLNVPKDKFKAKFDADYDELVKAGKVLSAKAACEYLGVSKAKLDELNYVQKKAGNLIKFGGGFYCGKLPGKVEGESIYVFNAFCGNMLDNYVAETSLGVCLFKVEWSEAQLSWDDFRGQKLGPTDPAQAPANSLRGLVYAKWKELGLPKEPNTGDNGLHGSASPFEAMAEVENWCSESLASQPFYQALLEAGVSADQVQEWKYEAQIKLADGSTGSSFDAVEDMSSTPCVEKLAALAKLN